MLALRLPIALAALVLPLALVVACSGGDDEPAAPTQPVPTSTTAAAAPAPSPTQAAGPSAGSGPTAVQIADFSYAPASLSVSPGQAVRLNVTNGGEFPHTFTIDGLVDSSTINPGASRAVEFTPAQAATLTYYCTIHGRARMSGQLVVGAGGQAGGGSAPAPPAAPTSVNYEQSPGDY